MDDNETQEVKNLKKDRKKDSTFSGILWWKIDKENVKKQAENYESLKLTDSSKGIASLLLIGSLVLSLVLSFFGWIPTKDVLWSIAIYLPIIIFVYKGNRIAIVVMMIAWTIEKTYSLVVSASANFQAYQLIIALGWWAIVMNPLYEAFKVEQLRKVRHKHAEATNDSLHINSKNVSIPVHRKSMFSIRLLIIIVIFIILLTGGGFFYWYQTNMRNNEPVSSSQESEDYFSKKLECANQTDRIKREIANEQERIDPKGEMFVVNFETIFYSPKTDSCLYVKSDLTKFKSNLEFEKEGIYQDKDDEFYLIIYDALTGQKFRSFRTDTWTFIQSKTEEYNQFLVEYQAK